MLSDDYYMLWLISVFFTESSPPDGFNGFCQVLVWQPPALPNGIVVGYEIEFSKSMENRIINSEDTYYKTTPGEQAMGGPVRVRHGRRLKCIHKFFGFVGKARKTV